MSQIETYRRCSELSIDVKMEKCPWFWFFDPKKSKQANRLIPYSIFRRAFNHPGNPEWRSFIEEWYLSKEKVSPLLYYGVNYL